MEVLQRDGFTRETDESVIFERATGLHSTGQLPPFQSASVRRKYATYFLTQNRWETDSKYRLKWSSA